MVLNVPSDGGKVVHGEWGEKSSESDIIQIKGNIILLYRIIHVKLDRVVDRHFGLRAKVNHSCES